MARIRFGGGGGGGTPSPFQPNTDETAIVPVDTQDSFIVGSDRMDRDTADATKNSRTFFNKVKGAFRTGLAEGTQWDDANVGSHSHAEGYNTRASSFNTHAEGSGTHASGHTSHAEGNTTLASGQTSHAEGTSTTASNNSSHAEGTSTTASGPGSHAEGTSAKASGDSSHAEGLWTVASGYASHAEGGYSQAIGVRSHADGSDTRAMRMASHASGSGSVARLMTEQAHAAGYFTTHGDAQRGALVFRNETTTATSLLLTLNAADTANLTGDFINVLTLVASRAYQLKISTVARRTDVQGEMAGWTWEGLVGRDSTGNARIIGVPVQAAWGDAPATDAWDVAVSINTTDATNNYVQIMATGDAGKTIRWVAKAEWVEVGG